MKKILPFVIIAAAICFAGCAGKQNKVSHYGSAMTVWLSDSTLALQKADTIKLGRMSAGETIVREITLRNDSPNPMVILSIENSCGCTAIEYDTKPIRPGDSTQISLIFRSDKLMLGMQQKPVSIRTSINAHLYRMVVTAEIY